MTLWTQTHTWPFATLAAAQTHRAVCRSTDALASYHSAVEPAPRTYRVRKLTGHRTWFTPEGLMSVNTCWIVERRDPDAPVSPPRKRTSPARIESGYTHCACRDCFEIAITSGGPALCHDCTSHGCGNEPDRECQRPDAYGCNPTS